MSRDSNRPSVTIAVDLAKSIFEIAASNPSGRILERRHMSRAQVECFWPAL